MSQENIDAAIDSLIQLEQRDVPVNHEFPPGVYIRECFMTAGSLVIGKKHRHKHLNVCLTGRATVVMDGVVHDIVAPCRIMSEAGCQKILFIHEDCVWMTIHPNPNDETDLYRLEKKFIIPSEEYSKTDLELLQKHIGRSAQIEG